MKRLLLTFIMANILALPAQAYDTRKYLPPLPLDKYLDNMYLKESLGFRVATPTSKQNVSINIKEVYFQHQFTSLRTGLLYPSLEVAVAQLNVADGKAYNYSVGPAIAVPISEFGGKLTLTGRGKVHWLTKHDFGRKRYGGPVQWTYAMGAKYLVSKNSFIAYEWQHMSNGDRYDFNPALETHNMVFGVNF